MGFGIGSSESESTDRSLHYSGSPVSDNGSLTLFPQGGKNNSFILPGASPITLARGSTLTINNEGGQDFANMLHELVNGQANLNHSNSPVTGLPMASEGGGLPPRNVLIGLAVAAVLVIALFFLRRR